jgi:molecular chaperone DnaJ
VFSRADALSEKVMPLSKRDYYEVLGVGRSATPDEIKKAYRKLARQFHPDANKEDPDTENKFKEVSEAYSVLGDEQKRAQYDQFGHLENGGGGGPNGDFTGDFGGFGDIFDMFFGGGRGFSGQQRRGPQRGSDLQYEMEISFHEAAFGLERDIEIPRIENCPTCDGSGAKPGTQPKTCPECHGTGQTQQSQRTPFGNFMNVKTCERCEGRGQIVDEPCSECRGQGKVRQRRKIHVKIPAGVDTGARMRMGGEGEAGDKGGSPGDLYIIIRVQPHPLFSRRDFDVFSEVPISFVQATLGDDLEVETLDGKVKLKVPAGTQTGSRFRIKGKGIPHLRRDSRGDHHVRVTVITPRKLTDRQKELLKEFGALGGDKVSNEDKGFFRKMKEAFGMN